MIIGSSAYANKLSIMSFYSLFVSENWIADLWPVPDCKLDLNALACYDQQRSALVAMCYCERGYSLFRLINLARCL